MQISFGNASNPVAILGWTELAKYRILQEEQKTNTAPFWAIFYHFETWLYTFQLFHPNYVSKCNERQLIKALKPKKGLNPSNSNHFCTRLSGLTHFWEMDGQNVHCSTHSVHPFLKNVWSSSILCQSYKSDKADFAGMQAKTNFVHPFIENQEKNVVAISSFLWPYNWPLTGLFGVFFSQKV